MLEKIQEWLVAKKVSLVAEVIADHAEIDGAAVNGTELCAEECEAMRAGIVAGLMCARKLVGGDHSDDLCRVATETFEDALGRYGRYLEEDENAEE